MSSNCLIEDWNISRMILCLQPTHVTNFQSSQFPSHASVVVHQEYRTEAGNEFVILGNSAIVKCLIPSFVADFVRVAGWIDETTGANFMFEIKNFGRTGVCSLWYSKTFLFTLLLINFVRLRVQKFWRNILFI